MYWTIRKRLLLTLILALVATESMGGDIFVNNRIGDDRRPGTSAEEPCQSIRRGLELANSGDRVIIAETGEPYRESLTLQAGKHSGISGRPFQIVGGGAILEGTAPVPEDSWEHASGDVYRYRPGKLSHQILYLNGKPANRKIATGSELPALSPLEWSLHQGHIYFRAEANRLPRQYALTHTRLPVGITIYEARHVVIQDLIVQGFQLDGINAHDSAMDTKLLGLVCRGNGRSGISVGGASRVTMIDCLVGDNGTAQVRTEGHCVADIVNCDLLENTAPGLVRHGGRVTRHDRD